METKLQRPDIIGDIWINTSSLTPANLDEKLVLVNFWSYACLKCQKMFPHLRRWWYRYKDYPFLLIGIHTPEFEFEKEVGNVRQAVREFGIDWPVVIDNDYINWRNFGNQRWPANFLFDPSGNLLFQQFGEDDYVETEIAIQEALKENSDGFPFPDIEPDWHSHGDACFTPTPDLYCGYARGRLDNSEGNNFDMPFRYRLSNGPRRNSIALLGSFVTKAEHVESANEGATLLLQFRATEVNLVLKPVEGEARVKLTFNGKGLPETIRGRDVSESGEIILEKPALYNLVKGDQPVEGILGITAQEGNFQAFMFTFSGCLAKK
jgi:thiol-disulfide isomerase/thioredoxin